MADLREHSSGLLARVELVDLAVVAATDLYTVPAGKILVLHYIVIRELSADAGATVATIGETGAATDFLAAQTLVALNAAASGGILMPVPNAATVKLIEYAEGDVIVIDVTTGAGGACTCTVEVFGTLMDA